MPVGGRPVIDYLIARMVRAGIDELRVVTRPEKADVVVHAEAIGARIVLGRPATLAESLLLGIRELVPDDVVLFDFPDTIWAPIDGFAAVLELQRRHPDDIALGLFRYSEIERGEAVSFDTDGRVRGIEFRPRHPTTDWGWGCLAARAAALDGLERHAEPGFYLDEQAHKGRVRGVPLGRLIDVGTRTALAAAADDPLVRDIAAAT